MDSYIRKEDMKDFCIYFCEARNFNYGIWHGGRMYGIRHKFGDSFIDAEYHWDDRAENYGSCKPFLQITTPMIDRVHPSFFDVSNWRGQGVLLDILSPFSHLVTGEVVAKAGGTEGGE